MTVAVQTPPLSPEMTFLLGCLQRHFGGQAPGCPRPVLDGEAAWVALLDIARRHAVIPHLYYSLRAIDPPSVPPANLAALQGLFETNARHNLYLTGTLRAILRAFEARGISALPYKGPALAVRLYGNIALRQFGDLDILVRPRDTRSAIELLLEQGYQPLNPGGATPAILNRFRKVCELRHPESQVCVELHWALTSWTFYFPLRLDSVWNRLETVAVADEPVRAMGIEDTLLSIH
ncbi:nucleotidyltransferase domain-containing protein [Candidatus Entotheonella palauensis]|uniref:nucleotidyltransferase domain-containing protein n=1 Tax=Candidatus Entotheonella palauensis TaxID=93172 RepID=UPI000B7EF55C|nr:nucleotidyltransferase family protein [Candidatus Entotheonella palauensis]